MNTSQTAKISPAIKVERYMVIVDDTHRCFVDVAKDIVIGFDIPQILYNPLKNKYVLEELKDIVLEAVVKMGRLINPHQECMKRINQKVHSRHKKNKNAIFSKDA